MLLSFVELGRQMKTKKSYQALEYLLLRIILVLALLLTLTACKKAPPDVAEPNDDPNIAVVDDFDELSNNFPCSEQGAMDYVSWLLDNDLSRDVGAYFFNMSENWSLQQPDYFTFFLLVDSLSERLYDDMEDSSEGYKKYLTTKDQAVFSAYLENAFEEWGDAEQLSSIFIYSLDEIKVKIASIWGKDKIDFSPYYSLGKYDFFFITEKDYLFFLIPVRGFEEANEVLYKTIAAKAAAGSSDRFTVQLQMIIVTHDWDIEDIENSSYDYGAGFSVYDFYNEIAYYELETIKPLDLSKMTLDQFIKVTNFKHNIGVLEVEVFHTDKGMRLAGRKAENKIVPYDYDNEWGGSYTVKASGGLKLRRGPGSNYDVITTISNNATVYVYGTLPKDNGWFFVEYYNESKSIFYVGWVSKDYLVMSEYD